MDLWSKEEEEEDKFREAGRAIYIPHEAPNSMSTLVLERVIWKKFTPFACHFSVDKRHLIRRLYEN